MSNQPCRRGKTLWICFIKWEKLWTYSLCWSRREECVQYAMYIYIYIIWYIPKTPKNQFKMDGNGETTMLVMYKDSRSSNWNNHLQMDSHQLPGMYTCGTCSSPIALGVKHHPPKQGSFLIKNTSQGFPGKKDNLGGDVIFLCSPGKLGKIPILTNSFQMG